jgi:hypothetical protein
VSTDRVKIICVCSSFFVATNDIPQATYRILHADVVVWPLCLLAG